MEFFRRDLVEFLNRGCQVLPPSVVAVSLFDFLEVGVEADVADSLALELHPNTHQQVVELLGRFDKPKVVGIFTLLS